MKVTASVMAILIAVLVAGLAPAGEKTTDPAINKLAVDWAAAFHKGDAKALSGYYTDNAVRTSQESGTVIGRAAIEKVFAANFAGPWKGSKIKIKVGNTYPIGSDVAVSEGTWEVSGTDSDGKPMTADGHFVNTLVKRADAWVIASNAVVPSAPVAP